MDTKDIRPFPGLRPFEENEEHLFFGREKSVSELLSRLRASRFLGVIGTSGSGKSSLVKSGLLPALYRGFMAGAGSRWRTALFRPGENPVGNLAKTLVNTGIIGGGTDMADETSDMSAIYGKFIETTLRRSSRGLLEVVKQSRLGTNENLLIAVDQFEELFRFSRVERASRKDGKRDSVVFVNMLLESARQAEIPIYIIITMRSDFLGDCTEFRGLPEAINDGQYLIPRMTRDEKRDAVTGPTAVAGAEVARSLLSRVLNDVGDNPDHLPILQHALMRTWDYWLEHHDEGEPLGLRHYEAIGTMERALSQHAEEAFAQVKGKRSRDICEKIFKLITDKGETGRGVRRPAKVSEMCLAANASKKEVIEILDLFRKPGRTFLMPPHGVELDWDSVIDISHESFMRIWTRLIQWVKEEARSAELYLRLAKAAALNEEGKAALWRDPELMLALNWRAENKPNTVWAERYDPSFERANNFLEAAKRQKELEIAEKERAQKAKIRRTRIFAAVISVAAVIAIVLAVWALNSEKKARKQTQIATEQQKKAEDSEKNAKEQKALAEKNERIAEVQKVRAEEKEKEAREATEQAEKNEVIAQKAETAAKKNEKTAKENELEARLKGLIVDIDIEGEKFSHAQAKAKELAVHSIAETKDNELKALLALTAYRLSVQSFKELRRSTREILAGFDKNTLDSFNGNKKLVRTYAKLLTGYNNKQEISKSGRQPEEIFAALREAYVAKEVSEDIIYKNTESWGVAVTRENNIVFNKRDGQLLMSTFQRQLAGDSKLGSLTAPIPVSKQFMIQARCFAEGRDRLYCGTQDGRIVYWNKNKWNENRQLAAHPAKILSMVYLENKKCLVYPVKNILYMHDLKDGPRIVTRFEANNYTHLLALFEDRNSRKSILISADAKGNIFQYDLSSTAAAYEKKRLNTDYKSKGPGFHATAYNPNIKMLAFADSRGEILLFPGIDCKSLSSGAKIRFSRFDKKHRGIVRALAFSPSGSHLASGGMDGIVMLWDLKGGKAAEITRRPPILTFESKRKILSLLFDSKGEYMLFNDEWHLRICPTKPGTFYEKLCGNKRRDFSPEEWNHYFGESIKPEDLKICSPLKEN